MYRRQLTDTMDTSSAVQSTCQCKHCEICDYIEVVECYVFVLFHLGKSNRCQYSLVVKHNTIVYLFNFLFFHRVKHAAAWLGWGISVAFDLGFLPNFSFLPLCIISNQCHSKNLVLTKTWNLNCK